MNKQILQIAILLCLTPFLSTAQITYEFDDFANPGDNFVFSTTTNRLENFNFQVAGEGQFWNFSNLRTNEQEEIRYKDTEGTEYFLNFFSQCVLETFDPFACGDRWPMLTNLSVQSTDSFNLSGFQLEEVEVHYRKTDSVLVETLLGFRYGSEGLQPPLIAEYDNPDTVYIFPINYQDEHTSQQRYEVNLQIQDIDFVYISNQTRESKVDAHGRLELPFFTLNRTLRMRTIYTSRDTAFIEGEMVVQPVRTEVEYKWFSKNFGTPVAIARGEINGDMESITRVDYLDVVRCLDPVARFIYEPLTPRVDPATGLTDTILFSNQSRNATDFEWFFGDGETSTADTARYSYDAPGNYIVRLIACNMECEPVSCDTTDFPLFVLEDSISIRADFIPSGPVCRGGTIFFSNESSNANMFFWDFGDDEATSIDRSPSHTYEESGEFEVTLIAINGAIFDTTVQTVTVYPDPIVDLGPDLIISTNDSVTLRTSEEYNTYAWSDFSFDSTTVVRGGDLGTGVHTYSVTVVDANGCTGSAEVGILVTMANSVEQLREAGIELFPNPVSTHLNIQFSPDFIASTLQAELYAINGRKIKQQTLSREHSQLSMTALPEGVYLLRLSWLDRQVSVRLVKY